MDVIVTIPKSEYGNIEKEIAWAKKLGKRQKRTASKNWTVSRAPKHIDDGDRCYFIRNGMITHYREIRGVQEFDHGFTCEVTDRDWWGPYLELDVMPVVLKKPVPMKGFQGWRYLRERPKE